MPLPAIPAPETAADHPTPPFLIGLDIGTSSAKAVVIDAAGRLLGQEGQEYPIHSPRAGWAEQDPHDWLAAALHCLKAAVAQSGIDPRQAAALGLAGQMHSLVCLDARLEPVRPAIIWADQRSGAQVRRLAARIGREDLGHWTGNPLATGFMLASWAWLAENEPENARAARWLLLPKDYVRFCLTGQIGAEPSDASSTGLFDPHRRAWSEPVLHAVGLEPSRLPVVAESAALAGGLLPEIANATGLPAGLPVVYGGSDVSLQALAQGIIEPGTVSCTIGTGGQLFAPIKEARHDPQLRLHLFCHALPGTWHHEAAILSAGLALRWLRDQLWPGADYAGLADAATSVEAGLEGLFFLPFLAGERTPYMLPGLRAGFLGLDLRHGQPHLVRAVMEGAVFALRQGLDLLTTLGTPVRRLVATGGSTRHPLWLQLQADIFNREIYVSQAEEATARGAALLAGVGAGVYADVDAAIQAAVESPRLGATPNTKQAGQYAQAYQDYIAWAEIISERYRSLSEDLR